MENQKFRGINKEYSGLADVLKLVNSAIFPINLL